MSCGNTVMDRREHLKLLLAGSIGVGLPMGSGCSATDRVQSERPIAESGRGYGRTVKESAHNERLQSETFFTEAERRLVSVLSDIIIPAGDGSGSASESGVVDFVEFMMKDVPSFQVPVRGGLMWLNNQCTSRYGKPFVECSSSEQADVVDDIAWPDEAKPEMKYGVNFFNRLRDLVATGFFTSQMGLEYLGYAGNSANFWDGVPEQVLGRHGLSYDQKTLDECIKPEERGRIAKWDEHANLI
jgi:gluconate 2-dehydrogenase gamma chain